MEGFSFNDCAIDYVSTLLHLSSCTNALYNLMTFYSPSYLDHEQVRSQDYFTTSAPKFLWGGQFSFFLAKIGLKSTKNVRFCILYRPVGARAPPPGYTIDLGTAKGPFGLRVKLPPAHLSTTHDGGFILSHLLLNVKQGSCEHEFF